MTRFHLPEDDADTNSNEWRITSETSIGSLRWSNARKYFSRILLRLILILVTLVFVVPFAWMVLSSFKPTGEIFEYAYTLSWKMFIPINPTLDNYISIMNRHHFGRALLNSFVASVAQMSLTVAICLLAAFVFSRLHFRGRNLLFGIVMFVSFIPFEVVMVPMYMVVRALGFPDTYPALFLPWVCNPLGVFLLRQAMLEIPRDFDDAAALEGASSFQILRHVIVPVIRPSIVTLGLISFLFSWNAFLWPLIVMADPNKMVIQVAMATFTSLGNLPAWGDIFAGASLATVPILILFISLQRFYIRGVVMTGLRG